jgi:hypothetical protein
MLSANNTTWYHSKPNAINVPSNEGPSGLYRFRGVLLTTASQTFAMAIVSSSGGGGGSASQIRGDIHWMYPRRTPARI